MSETQVSTKPKATRSSSKAAAEPRVDTIVVKFPSSSDAEKAMRTLNRTLRDEEKTIYQGALVSRKADGELRIRDISEVGLGSIAVDAADATLSIGMGGIGLLLGAATAGLKVLFDTARLAKVSAGQVMNLASETLTYPTRKLLGAWEAAPEVLKATKSLDRGEIAIVVTADEKTARELAADLEKQGGEVV
jgi:hypothetical protein